MRIHLDFGPICWQFVSVVQPNVEHEEDGEEGVHEVTSETERTIGFGPNEEE